MEICVDFDGTCTTHEYPFIGADIGAVEVLKALVKKGHKLIIFTMRSGERLKEAYDWYKMNGIEVYGVQSNPSQTTWTSSPKAYAQLYIDDAALGCPLKQDRIEVARNNYLVSFIPTEKENGKTYLKPSREYVDWVEVKKILKKQGIL